MPAANPYPLEHLGTLFVLVVVFTLWRRIRPRPNVILRCYAGLGAALAFLAIVVQACGNRVSIDGSYRLALKSALLVAASLFIEIVQSWRRRAFVRAISLHSVPTEHKAVLGTHEVVVADESGRKLVVQMGVSQNR